MMTSPRPITYTDPKQDTIKESAFTSNEQAITFVENAAQHGHETGHCCFCNKKLDDEKSVTLGCGPVCAKNYGLSRSVKTKEEQA